MRTRTKTLILAMTAGLLATGAVHAQKDPSDGIAPAGPSLGLPLGGGITGDTCTGSGGTNCPAAIPDGVGFNPATPGVLTSSFDVTGCTEVVDANVGIDTTHTWVGDLIYTVTSPGGTAVTVIDRPGVPASAFGCRGNSIEAVLNDAAVAPVEDECASPPWPTIGGIFTPNNPLAAFNGDLGTGTWQIDVSDNEQFDTGTLNDWSLDLVCNNHADLAVTKTASSPIVAGADMTYEVTVSNAGPAPALSVVATETIPPGTTFVSTSGCNNDISGVPSCALGDMAAGTIKVYTVTVAVPANMASGAVLSNTVEVASNTDDPRVLDNTFTLDTPVTRSADISISKTESIDPVLAGSGGNNLIYTVTVVNNGPSDVTGLIVNEALGLPTGVVLSSVSPTTGSWSAPNWTLDLADGASATLTVRLTAGSSAPVGTDNILNTASVAGSAGGESLTDNGPATQNTSIIRNVDIAVTKSENMDPVVAGSGNNLVYTVTAVNNGPSDVTNLVINDAITVPANVGYLASPSAGSWSDPNWTVSLASGASATLTVTVTVPLQAAEGTNVISDTASVSGSGGGESITNTGNDSASAATSIRWPAATFNVAKQYNGGTGASVNVELQCSDSTGLGVGDPASGGTDTALVWKRFDQLTATACSVVETVPAGSFEIQRTADCDIAAVADGGVYNCTLTNADTVARFHVTKDFSDGSTDDVEVTLTCDTGLPLIQSLTIAGGDPTGVTFVVTDFVDTTMSCAVTEVTNTPGYDVDKSGCVWNNVMSIESPFACVVNNEAQDATFTANMVWDFISTGGDQIDARAYVTIGCNSEITNTYAYYSSGNWWLRDWLSDGESLTATVKTTTGPATCWASQYVASSAVETSDDCSSRLLPAGSSDSCTFVNTVFFEGIPTLSQYGLAILALLMLGVGMVGFRRFV